uniref:Ribosomal protein L20 n=1 Tax=Synarthrophyton chejuense TaxID=2485825 RepID=A0A3G3MIM2_9FLOR|nr:ribosomal protein L20 [Synarthrophyton chejuense]AYR06628.1 ribosomal protein L20 [Synarthrophyton chejuense]
MLVYHLIIKNNNNYYFSRKHKKLYLRKYFINMVNSSSFFYNQSLSYKFLSYFFKINKINLNNFIVYKTFIEELGSSFSLQNWLFNFYFKKY